MKSLAERYDTIASALAVDMITTVHQAAGTGQDVMEILSRTVLGVLLEAKRQGMADPKAELARLVVWVDGTLTAGAGTAVLH